MQALQEPSVYLDHPDRDSKGLRVYRVYQDSLGLQDQWGSQDRVVFRDLWEPLGCLEA